MFASFPRPMLTMETTVTNQSPLLKLVHSRMRRLPLRKTKRNKTQLTRLQTLNINSNKKLKHKKKVNKNKKQKQKKKLKQKLKWKLNLEINLMNLKKLLKKHKHMHRNTRLLTRFQTQNYQKRMIFQILMDLISQVQWETKDHVVPATLCHSLK